MTNLVPEKRVDKNGVLTTKHVRSGSKQSSPPTTLPAPQIAAEPALSASTVQKRWRVNINKWDHVDRELKHLCSERFTAGQTYKVSEAEAYDVLSAVGFGSALPLLAIGVRSGAEAQQFLHDNGLERLGENNAKMVAQAIDKGHKALAFIQFGAKHATYAYRSPRYRASFMDAAEAALDPHLGAVDAAQNGKLCSMILQGQARMSDIRELGFPVLHEHGLYDDSLLKHLALLQQGRTSFESASDMRAAIENASAARAPVRTALNIAAAFGSTPDEIASFDWNERRTVDLLAEELQHTDCELDERKKILSYRLEMGKLNISPEAVIELCRNNVSKDDVMRGMESGLTVAQTIALAEGNVTPSLATGLL